MTLARGADSVAHVDAHITSAGGGVGDRVVASSSGLFVWDFWVRRFRQQPQFWGRYINNSSASLDRQEVEFIQTKSGGRCRIALIYNQLGSATVVGVRGSVARDIGRRAGENAVNLANALLHGQPGWSTRLFLDIEQWPVAPDLILGWFESIYQSDYLGVGGLYGHVYPAVPLASVSVARRQAESGRSAWSTSLPWTRGRFAEEQSVPQIVDDILAGQLRVDRDYSCTLWDPSYITPERHVADPPPDWPVRFEQGFNPGGQITVWQFGRDPALREITAAVPATATHPARPAQWRHMYDLDVATPRGLAEMWLPR